MKATIVILGVTGDLSVRKLLPALSTLKDVRVIGAARSKSSVAQLITKTKSFVPQKKWSSLKKRFSYCQLDFYEDEGYLRLKKIIEKKKGVVVFYLATLPQHFAHISQKLAEHKLVQQQSRVVFEKPFGQDVKSAQKINQEISKVFSEKQIYRIDHYLGKELVDAISLLRFTNQIFEPLWNKTYIDNIQITLNEAVDVKHRATFYNKYGVIRDVVQNHMLQLLALIGMEQPKRLSAKNVRDQKVAVLKKVQVEDFFLGQYQEFSKEVGKKSKTPTFAAFKLKIATPRWQGVPFYLRSGKALEEKNTRIEIVFKKVPCLLDVCPQESNRLTIRIAPQAEISFMMNSKVPKRQEVLPVKMNFCHSCLFGVNTPTAYEALFKEIVAGNQTPFVRFDEVVASWSVLEKSLSSNKRVHPYKKKSIGPKEFESWSKKQKVRWI